MKQILHLVPSQNLFFFAFIIASIIAFFPPRIWGVRATFKAVLTAVDMKYQVDTYGLPGIIQHFGTFFSGICSRQVFLIVFEWKLFADIVRTKPGRGFCAIWQVCDLGSRISQLWFYFKIPSDRRWKASDEQQKTNPFLLFGQIHLCI